MRLVVDEIDLSGPYKDLAEAVIKTAMKDLEHRSASTTGRFNLCRFFTDEFCKDLYTGLAPHMIRDWEAMEKKAEAILEKEFKGWPYEKGTKK